MATRDHRQPEEAILKMGAVPAQGKRDAGYLPAWGTADLPAPPPFNFANALKLIGPGAIALGISIGSGEWLLGPTVTAKYGAGLLWVATLSILIQYVLNTEVIRYTLYTGEPIFTGFMRTAPGPAFWGVVYTLLFALQVGWPGWAKSAATAITAGILGRVPTAQDQGMVMFWAYATFILCIVLLAFGRKVQKTMEILQWFFVAWILVYLVGIDLFATSLAAWGKVWGGFAFLGGALGSRMWPDRGDWILLASFAAYAGMGGLVNGTLSNWVRDKGWGMGATVGYIPAMIGGVKVNLSRTGNTFRLTPENLNRFNEWWKYVVADQWWVWAVGCFLGMALPAILTVTYVPPNAKLNEWGIAAVIAEGIKNRFGQVFWLLTLLNGFWILFSTQIGQLEAFVRTTTDILWTGSSKVREWTGGDVRKVYYSLLVFICLLGMVLINFSTPFYLIVIGAFISGVNFVVLTIHTMVVQKKFLPAELQPSPLRRAVLYFMVLFFGFFSTLGILNKVFGINI